MSMSCSYEYTSLLSTTVLRRRALTSAPPTHPSKQVVANVFGADVYTVNSPNAAALGCAFRAKHGGFAQQLSRVWFKGHTEPYIEGKSICVL